MTDEELAELALAADPEAPLEPGAVPIDVYLGTGPAPLPEWYMPAPRAHRLRGRHRMALSTVVGGLVGAFVLIEAFGLCSTYGQLPFH